MKAEKILDELIMLTGKVSTDKNYLYYLLVKDGSYFEKPKESNAESIPDVTVNSLEDWFNSLEEDIQ